MYDQGSSMRILLAPNALKGSLSAEEAAAAMARGVKRAIANHHHLDLVSLPVADGGDGAADVLRHRLGAEPVTVSARDALGRLGEATFYINREKRLALMDMASVCGLARLTPSEYAPLEATTLGLGDLISAAMDAGAEDIIIGIGGSASTDGGTGMAHALGIRFLDESGQVLEPGGFILDKISQVDLSGLDPRSRHLRIRVMCDVDNPLIGPNGAAHVYAAQKGASPQQIVQLEAGLNNLAQVLDRQLGIAVSQQPGAGAAGGLGAGLRVFLGAELGPGVQILLDLLAFDEALEEADLVITAEGAVDEQTAFGKAPAGVARRAQLQNIPCICLCGGMSGNLSALHEAGMDGVFSICPKPVSLENAMKNAAEYLELATEQAVRAFNAGYNRQKN
jgi:glycerate kinase